MKSISYTVVSTEQAAYNFCHGYTVSIYVNGDFWCGLERSGLERSELRRMKARHLKKYTRILLREARYAQKEGKVTFRTRPAIRN